MEAKASDEENTMKSKEAEANTVAGETVLLKQQGLEDAEHTRGDLHNGECRCCCSFSSNIQ